MDNALFYTIIQLISPTLELLRCVLEFSYDKSNYLDVLLHTRVHAHTRMHTHTHTHTRTHTHIATENNFKKPGLKVLANESS